MAFIQFKSGRCKSIPAEKGATLWRFMQGEIEGTPEMKKYADTIARLWLNKNTAPESYLLLHYPKEQRVTTWKPYKE